MTEGFKAKVVVFCICGHMMCDNLKGYVTCLNPGCPKYGKDYRVTVDFTEKQAVRV